MPGHDYSYIDLCVLPVMRDQVLAGDPAILFSGELDAVLWCNAPGARLLTGGGIAGLLEADLPKGHPFLQQVADAVSQDEPGEEIERTIRLDREGTSLDLHCRIQRRSLPEGSDAVLFSCTSPGLPKITDPAQLARHSIDALDGFADAAGILGPDGTVMAASDDFSGLAPSGHDMVSILDELIEEDDRLIKRLVTGTSGKQAAAGFALLSRKPIRALLVLADTGETQTRKTEPAKPETGPGETELSAMEPVSRELPGERTERLTLAEPADEKPDPDVDGDTKDVGAEPVRFAWFIDHDGIFQSVSPALAETVGENAADIIGRSWKDVATVFGFDLNGTIATLLGKQDTWSGKTVLWPVEGTDMVVPVDLAALPVFGAGRKFEGFRGFGIIRTADMVIDPEETGLALAASDDAPEKVREQEPPIAIISRRETGEDGPVDDAGETDEEEDKPSNIVPLRPVETPLSDSESNAFEEIGDRLKDAELGSAVSGNEAADPDTSLMDTLPVAIVIYRSDAVLYANQVFLDASGYGSLSDMEAAGGVEALIETREGQGERFLVRDDGSQVYIEPVLRTVPWQGEKALLISFPAPSEPDQDGQPETADMATEFEAIRSILDTASDGIIVTEQDGSIVSLNTSAQALFARDETSTLGEPLESLFAHESRKVVSDYLSGFSAPGVSALLNDGRDVIGREANGGLIPLFLTLTQVGDTGRLCALLRDMTDWKKAEEELLKSRRDAELANEQKSEFLAQVSHEIRTPLNAIIGFSDVMIEERFGPIENQRYREYLRDINRSGIHVLDLVNDLLDLSKIEAGKLELSFEAVDLNKVVAETVALLQPQANGNRIIIRTSLSRAVPKVVADIRSIRQVILNLVSNAIKYTSANGQVIVSTVYEQSGEVGLRVRDTGEGMTQSEIEQALQPFKQLRGVRERKIEGTGLGLPLTKALVEANRAQFDLESEPQQGTVAHVQFPSQRVLAD